MTHPQIVNFLWGVADLIGDTFKRGKYQDVILPLTVLRRLDCVLAPSKKAVFDTYTEYKDKLDNLDPLLRSSSGFAFYNTSEYNFERLLADASNLTANLRHWIAGFSPNMREVIEKFDFDNTIAKLNDAGLLFHVMERFNTVDLHPDSISDHEMGTLFAELIYKFNEALADNPGEHFTSRDVVHLMVELMLAGDEERIRRPGAVVTVYDPCCGTGGILAITKQHILGDKQHLGINSDAEVHLVGQEVNPETFAVCKSDLLMKDPTGRDADEIRFGSTLSSDRHAGRNFDYLIANPPYGKDWKRDKLAADLKGLESTLVEIGEEDGETLLSGLLARSEAPSLAYFVRSLVGLDRSAAQSVFSEFLNDRSLTPPQIRFVEMVITQLTSRGIMEASALYEPPFSNLHAGGPDALFDGKENVIEGIFEKLKAVNSEVIPQVG